MPVWRADPRYVAVLAIACAAILLIGSLLKPAMGPDESAAPTPDLPQLGRFADRRMLERIADHFAFVATQVEESVVLLVGTGQSGVVWQAGEVVTSSRLGPFPAADRTALQDREVALTTALSAPHLPYVLLNAPLAEVVSSRRPVRLYPLGSWVLAVWRSRAGGLRYTPGNLFGVAPRRCGDVDLTEVLTNVELRANHVGAGIFSLDGGLIAVVLDCGGTLFAAEAGDLELRARTGLRKQDLIPQRHGMRLAAAQEAELRHFGRPAGVVVREIWWGHGAHAAGLLPGDLVLAIDDVPVESIEDLDTLVLPLSREFFELLVLRGGRRIEVRLQARPARAAAAVTRGFVTEEAGVPVEAVMGDSLAAKAGALPGDRLVAVNQVRTRTRAELLRAFRRARGETVHVVIARDRYMWATMVGIDE